MIEKYKVCPVCGAHNSPLSLACSDCDADLQNILVVDEEMERVVTQSGVQNIGVNSASVMVRVCDCGTKNPVQARRCSKCGEDISTIIPTPDIAVAPNDVSTIQHYVLSSLDGTHAYEIKDGRTVIGREHEMQVYLSSKPYVSRKHAELTLDTATAILKIKNCSTTNYTFVNNQLLSEGMTAELKDGDEIGLGGNEQNGSRQPEAAYFLVRIGSCI